ncbi:hypothetical protein [Kiritimatiella glycovorans]|uniref:DUF3604 domain-containing protein n=1 Tax=Kiritimatiella glycovorans TaxID=1307763 RepID=A0A0G3EFM9_9BACT|nr:hypothetical protein [Kiritimatiella glycovorans]AKJ65153.1 hypothetical protein L21SP4_01918 [Kiritimatiella glycovorans]
MKQNRRGFIAQLGVAAGATGLTPFVTRAYDGSGAGSARILEPDRLVAGTKTRVVVEVAVGAGGIPVGGGIWVGVHHAALWNTRTGHISKFQVDNPDAPNYIGVEGPDGVKLENHWYGWAPNESMHRAPGGPPAMDWSGSTPLIYHQCIQTKISGRALREGEKVRVIFGANRHKARVPSTADPNHEFFVATDSDADGVFEGIGEYPARDIEPAAADHLIATAPMVQVRGEPFELLVRAEDAFYNTAVDFEKEVEVRDEDGSVLRRGVRLRRGMARIRIELRDEGPHRLRLRGGGLEGRGEPIRVFNDPPANRIWFGDIHGHTRVSDGCGTMEEYYRFGRDEANLDVCALSDHWHYDWPGTQQIVRDFYEPGRYVTLLAEEAGTHFDHINFYHRTVEAPHSEYYTPKYGGCLKLAWEQYNRGGPVMAAGPHHFAYDRGEKTYPWGEWDPRSCRFAEVYSCHGTAEYAGNPRSLPNLDPDKTLQAGLAQGIRTGVIACSDTHVSRPGRCEWMVTKNGMTAFVAPRLDRESIWDALWNRSVYATTFDRIYLDFSVNGTPMGQETESGGRCRLAGEVAGRDGGMDVVFLRDNEEIRRERSENGVVEFEFDDDPGPGEHFYYVRVEQDNGERAWSTPVWVKA